MKIHKIECPNCGYSFKPEEPKGICECPACNTSLYVDDEKQIPSIVNININNYAGAKDTLSPPEGSKSAGSKAAGGIFALIIFLLIAAVPMSIFKHIRSGVQNTSSSYRYRSIPESKPFVDFVRQVYGKKAADISPEDYASIKYIYIDREILKSEGSNAEKKIWRFDYAYSVDKKGNPIDMETVRVDGGEAVEQKDLQAFTNIVSANFGQSLDFIWDKESYSGINYKNLKKLRYYQGNSLSTLMDAFADPSQIESLDVSGIEVENEDDISIFSGLKSLGIDYVDEEEELESISKFKNLENLDIGYIHSDTVMQLDFLSSLSKLKVLRIKTDLQSDISGTEVLYGLPGIEELELENIDSIRNIDFIRNMPKLNRLRLENCPIRDIEVLRGNTALIELRLDGMNALTDVSALSTMTSLRKLELLLLEADSLPDLSPLSVLREVKMDSYYLESIYGMQGIESLNVRGYYRGEEEVIASLSGLKKLSIKWDNWSGDTGTAMSLALTALPNLEELDIELGSFSGIFPLTPIFASESIHTLSILNPEDYIEQVLALDFNTLPENTVLKKLTLKSIKVADIGIGEEVENDSFDVYGDDFFKHFPSIEELYIENNYIQNLDFVSNMPNLRILDISNNYVSDVTPLLDCTKLEKLIYRNNSIYNLNILPASVYVTDMR